MTVHVDLPTPIPAKYVYDFTEGGRELELGGEVALAEIGLPGWPVALLERARRSSS